MPSPGASQALTRPDIRNAVVTEWDANGEKDTFIADQVAKRVDVDFMAGTVKRIPREMFTKDVSTADRGPAGAYGRTTFGDETFNYFTKEQGHEVPMDQNMVNQAKTWYDAEVVAGKICLSKLMRKHEIDVAAAVFSTATFTGSSLTTSVTNNWTSAASSATPIDDVIAAKLKVRQNCGRVANSIIISYTLWENMLKITQLINRINGGATTDLPAAVMLKSVASLFEIDRIIVAKGVKDSAAEGQTFTGADVWLATRAMVCYINPSASLLDINLCNVYNWEGDGGSFDWTFESYRSESDRTDIIRARRQVGIKCEYPECGHLLTNVG